MSQLNYYYHFFLNLRSMPPISTKPRKNIRNRPKAKKSSIYICVPLKQGCFDLFKRQFEINYDYFFRLHSSSNVRNNISNEWFPLGSGEKTEALINRKKKWSCDFPPWNYSLAEVRTTFLSLFSSQRQRDIIDAVHFHNRINLLLWKAPQTQKKKST